MIYNFFLQLLQCGQAGFPSHGSDSSRWKRLRPHDPTMKLLIKKIDVGTPCSVFAVYSRLQGDKKSQLLGIQDSHDRL